MFTTRRLVAAALAGAAVVIFASLAWVTRGHDTEQLPVLPDTPFVVVRLAEATDPAAVTKLAAALDDAAAKAKVAPAEGLDVAAVANAFYDAVPAGVNVSTNAVPLGKSGERCITITAGTTDGAASTVSAPYRCPN